MSRTRITPTPLLLARALVAACAAMATFPLIADAILVAPHALYLTDRRPTGEIFLVNQGDQAEDVSIELVFGYPESDSTGQMQIRMLPDPGPEFPSAARWLRAFPRRLQVPAGRRQAVRIQATPPAGLPDGEYWSRLVVTSRPAREAALGPGDTVVRAGIVFELRTVTSVAFRKGAVSTALRLDSARAELHGDSVVAWAGLTREGNAAYIGSVSFDLVDAAGKVVQAWAPTPVAVYYGVNRRFPLPLDGPHPGSHELRMTVSTTRTDIPANVVLPAPPLGRRIPIVLP